MVRSVPAKTLLACALPVVGAIVLEVSERDRLDCNAVMYLYLTTNISNGNMKMVRLSKL